ncbi:30S ribosomal protein S12 methylthiotransferase RimO [Oligoflexia bacterium]|nr:30S ribosomal protein S12 methylthiotransferase RimO [Oligoflexia bacterium]
MEKKLPIVGQDDQEGADLAQEDLNDTPTLGLKGRVAIITLGCAKNQVDSEVILGVLSKAGFEIVSEIEAADIAVINTCGFLESAVRESVDCVLEVAQHKEAGRLRRVIVVGCMVERYRDELRRQLPEVDAFVGSNNLLEVVEAAHEQAQAKNVFDGIFKARDYLYDDTTPRLLSDAMHSAYIKISEGCSKPCSFCTIPSIKGKMRNRKSASVIKELEQLTAMGVKEVNLIAQDTSAYKDDSNGADLATLLEMIDQTGLLDWLRVLYAYPTGISDRLLTCISDLPSVCEYLDIPLQHSSPTVLKPMCRPLGNYAPKTIVDKIKTNTPDIHLRTTFIVGFPGETEEAISDLEAFVSSGYFSSVGVFTYSNEEGTPAFALDGQIAEEVKQERRERIMLAQQRVNSSRLAAYIGSTLPVLVEGTHPDTEILLSARTRFQAPEVDGRVIINDIKDSSDAKDKFEVEAGTFGVVEITEVAGYDLVGTLVSTKA